MFGSQTASHGATQMSLGQRRSEVQRDVVGEDHAEAEDEAAKLAVAAVGRAEREADHAEDEAGHRDRELPVDRHDLVVRRLAVPSISRRARLQFGDRHLGIALRAARRAETPTPGSDADAPGDRT